RNTAGEDADVVVGRALRRGAARAGGGRARAGPATKSRGPAARRASGAAGDVVRCAGCGGGGGGRRGGRRGAGAAAVARDGRGDLDGARQPDQPHQGAAVPRRRRLRRLSRVQGVSGLPGGAGFGGQGLRRQGDEGHFGSQVFRGAQGLHEEDLRPAAVRDGPCVDGQVPLRPRDRRQRRALRAPLGVDGRRRRGAGARRGRPAQGRREEQAALLRAAAARGRRGRGERVRALRHRRRGPGGGLRRQFAAVAAGVGVRAEAAFELYRLLSRQHERERDHHRHVPARRRRCRRALPRRRDGGQGPWHAQRQAGVQGHPEGRRGQQGHDAAARRARRRRQRQLEQGGLLLDAVPRAAQVGAPHRDGVLAVQPPRHGHAERGAKVLRRLYRVPKVRQQGFQKGLSRRPLVRIFGPRPEKGQGKGILRGRARQDDGRRQGRVGRARGGAAPAGSTQKVDRPPPDNHTRRDSAPGS
ncbi:hypothetical protein M885DRAFT_586628, partial [Pelagophyceae sp. CCMP2097]